MTIIKRGEANIFSQSDFRSPESIEKDDVLHNRLISLASNLKKIAPKADDFLYFTAIMMHAAERSILDEDGNVLKDKHGNDVEAHWEINEKTGSWKWKCSESAIKPYKNANGDIFPESQLKTAYKKWVGKPLCKDHISSSMDGVRGLILDTYWDEKYKRIISLCALDKVNFPELARNVETGIANCVSMGTGVETSICADCGNVARTERDYCNCVKNRTAYGEINVGLMPIELSLVVNGADQRAKIMEVIAQAEQMKNNICKHASEYSQNELDNLRIEFAKLAKRVYELESEVANSDNNLALRRIAGTNDIYTYDLSAIKNQISNVENMLKVIANKFNMEDLMAAQNNMSKSAYHQGTEEPVAPGKPQYAKEEADKIRMEDSHMKAPLTDLGPVDGLPKQDLEIKKRLLRASIEERRAIRAAALEKAQATIKTAYPQGTEELPKGGYPVDPGNKVRDTEFTVTKTQGNTGSWGEDEKVKKLLSRASLKARLEKGASVGENKWNIISESDNKVVFAATFDELSNRKPAFYATVASEDFVRDLMKTIRAHGIDGATKLYKSAQDASAVPAPAPAMPAAEQAPVQELAAPVEGDKSSEVSVPTETVEKLENASEELSTAVSEMKGGADVLNEQGEQLGATPSEAETEQALADLTSEAPANVTASLNVVRKVINAGLAKKFKKNVKKLATVKSEIDMLVAAAKDNTVNPTLLTQLAGDAIAMASETLDKSRILKASYVEFAKGTYNLQKRAAEERRMVKMAQTATPAPSIGAKPAQSSSSEKKEDPNKTKTPEEVAKEATEKTAAERRALRHSLAASISSGLKYSDMLGKAHPKPDTTLGGVAGTSEAVVEGLPSVQKQMMDAVSHEPKAAVKKAAEELRKLVVAGKVSEANIDNMVKSGMDKEVAAYYKKMWAPADGGAEFAAGLLKEYSAAKSVEKKAEDLDNYKAKYARAYELAYEMADAGMISKKSSAIKEHADKIVNYNDDAFETLKRVTAQRNVMNVKTAAIQPGISVDSGSSVVGNSSPVGGEDLASALTGLWSTAPAHKRG